MIECSTCESRIDPIYMRRALPFRIITSCSCWCGRKIVLLAVLPIRRSDNYSAILPLTPLSFEFILVYFKIFNLKLIVGLGVGLGS